MSRQLREPQRLGLEFLLPHKRANLFAQMGIGKTAMVEHQISRLALERPTLVLGPLRVARKVWGDEAQEWDELRHLRVATITGTPAERLAALNRPAHIHTINYDNIEWLMDALGKRWPFGMVVADESTRLKGFRLRQGTKRAKALSEIAHRTDRWINLTGTPASNGLLDLWGPQWFVDGGAALSRSYSAFEDRWFYKPTRGDTHSKPLPFDHSFAQIMEALRPTTLSLRAADYFQIDEPVVTEIRVDLPPKARLAYRQMAKHALAEIQGQKVAAFSAAAKSTKLLQLASGAIYHDEKKWTWAHDAKLEALESIVEETGGAPLLVAYNYVHELERILKRFPQARQLVKRRDEDDWNAGKIPMLVAHPDSCGHGLNLQHGGNILVYFGHTWKQESHSQILERIGPLRQMQSGYKRPVFVYSIVADNTADEAVIARNAGKASLMEALLDSLRRSAG